MIQRIQSIFLFASLCFLVPLFSAPVAELIYEGGDILSFNLMGFYVTEADAVTYVSNQYSIMLFGMLICALNTVIIFLFKHRVLQLRLCIYNLLLLIGLTGVGLFVLFSVQDVQRVVFGLPAVFPVIAIILHYLAFRGIRKDELMVMALSRLR